MPRPFRGNELVELVKYLVEQRVSGLSIGMNGTITSVDPNTHMAKVLLDVADVETGWLPIGTILAGPGYGVVVLPVDGTHVTVLFEGGEGELSDRYASGKILLCDFNAVDTLPSTTMKPGEILMQSVGGASAKLDASGHITLNGGTEGVARVGDSIQVTISGATYTGVITTGSSTVKA